VPAPAAVEAPATERVTVRVPARRGRRPLPAALAAGALALGVLGAGVRALSGGDGAPPAPATGSRATPVTASAPADPTATATPSARTPTPTPAATATRTPTATATPTRAPVRLSLPTDPGDRLPVPDGIDPAERAVLETLNRVAPALAAAYRAADPAPLRAVFSGTAYAGYAVQMGALRAAGQYAEAELKEISLVALRFDDADHVYARTIERWRSTVFQRGTGRRLQESETVYQEEYRLRRVDGAWTIAENTSTALKVPRGRPPPTAERPRLDVGRRGGP
jgi:hypothetical protein